MGLGPFQPARPHILGVSLVTALPSFCWVVALSGQGAGRCRTVQESTLELQSPGDRLIDGAELSGVVVIATRGIFIRCPELEQAIFHKTLDRIRVG